MEQRKRPEPLKEYLVNDLGDGIFNITAPPMRFQQYLVLGEEKALLIDSGFGMDSLKKIVDGLTDLPIILVNTHGHPDHGGGNAEFGSPYLHPDDNELYAYKCSYEMRLEEAMHWGVEGAADRLQKDLPAPIPMEDGHAFDLGGRTLTVFHTPGHSRGSVCIFDEATGTLFTGDNVQAMATALLEDCATNVSTYLASMKKIALLPVKRICGGHMPPVLTPDYIGKKIECAKRVLAGEEAEYVKGRMGEGYMMTVDGTSIHYTADRAN